MTELSYFAPALLAPCEKYPQQAAPLIQAWTDLSLAQSWEDLEVVDVDECECVVLRGKSSSKSTPSFVFPTGLATPTSIEALNALFSAISKRFPSTSAAATATEDEAPTLYLAIVEKDSSIVYYVLRKGIISPKEVPE